MPFLPLSLSSALARLSAIEMMHGTAGGRRCRARSFPSLLDDGRDFISVLPDECLSHIFGFLDSPKDRCSCAAVSRRWLILQAFLSASSSSAGAGEDDGEAAPSRRFHCSKASDACLAAMAVGSCRGRSPTEIHIQASPLAATRSSLMSVSDMGLAAVSQVCYKLRSLSLWNCVLVGDEGLAAVARFCPQLQKLDISNVPKLSDGGLIAIAKGCRKLSTLRLETCPLVGDGALRAFAKFCLELEFISIGSCPLVGDSGFISVLSSLPKLGKVRIAGAVVGDGSLAAIGERAEKGALGFLSLSLDNVSGFSGEGFRRLSLAQNLRSLELRFCPGLDDAAFFVTGSAFAGLRSLILSGVSLTDRGLVRLSETAMNLESLELEKCHEVTTEGLLVALRNWSRSLRGLSLVQCDGVGKARREGGDSVDRCHLLRSLKINGCPRVSDEFLSSLGRRLVQPKRLALMGLTAVGDNGVVSLLVAMQRRDGLRSVDISGCPRITDWSVAALVAAASDSLRRLAMDGCDGVTDKSLKLIGLFCPALVELDLSWCRRIGDGGVAGLLACAEAAPPQRNDSRLQVLSLEGCGGITDQSLRRLEEMALQGSLAGLNLKHCVGLSADAVAAVRRTLWWCDLIF